MNPFSWTTVTVIPYLGSFFIDSTVPASDANTELPFSAFISTPKWTVHSCHVSEYVKLESEKSFAISPSNGTENCNSTGLGVSFTSGVGVSFIWFTVLLVIFDVFIAIFYSFKK